MEKGKDGQPGELRELRGLATLRETYRTKSPGGKEKEEN
jgi:hypothetical protein